MKIWTDNRYLPMSYRFYHFSYTFSFVPNSKIVAQKQKETKIKDAEMFGSLYRPRVLRRQVERVEQGLSVILLQPHRGSFRRNHRHLVAMVLSTEPKAKGDFSAEQVEQNSEESPQQNLFKLSPNTTTPRGGL